MVVFFSAVSAALRELFLGRGRNPRCVSVVIRFGRRREGGKGRRATEVTEGTGKGAGDVGEDAEPEGQRDRETRRRRKKCGAEPDHRLGALLESSGTRVLEAVRMLCTGKSAPPQADRTCPCHPPSRAFIIVTPRFAAAKDGLPNLHVWSKTQDHCSRAVAHSRTGGRWSLQSRNMKSAHNE